MFNLFSPNGTSGAPSAFTSYHNRKSGDVIVITAPVKSLLSQFDATSSINKVSLSRMLCRSKETKKFGLGASVVTLFGGACPGIEPARKMTQLINMKTLFILALIRRSSLLAVTRFTVCRIVRDNQKNVKARLLFREATGGVRGSKG